MLNWPATLNALGIDPASELLHLQQTYQLMKAQLEFFVDLNSARAKLFSDLPVSDMIKRGWLKGVTDVRDRTCKRPCVNFLAYPRRGY